MDALGAHAQPTFRGILLGAGYMSSQSERRKKRYAEDPEYRERTLADNLAWKEAHYDQVIEARRRKYAENPPSRLQRMYGISDQDYEAMLARQGGTCAICKTKPPGQKLGVDHCHICNKVRRLLCPGCNLGLGHYKDDPRLTRAATAYLDEFRCSFCCPGIPLPRERGRGTGRNSARLPTSLSTAQESAPPIRRQKARSPTVRR
jgi:Recombination endonuclease VII